VIAIYFLTLDFAGASVIESIKNKISLLSLMHGLNEMETNLTNLVSSIEQCAIGSIENKATDNESIIDQTLGIITKMIKPAEVDRVSCMICGAAPKIVCTDGNTKVGKTHLYQYWKTHLYQYSLKEDLSA
jgi:precorrin-4 methylase